MPARKAVTGEAVVDFFAHSKLLTPPVKRAAYSDRTAWLMAECSRIAYQDLDKLAQPLSDGGFALVETFDDTESGTQAFLARREDMAVLAFRGTQKDWQDIRRDLNLRFYQTEAGRAHKGFLKGYEAVSGHVSQAVDALGDLPLYLTGHSLGGALATVATSRLARDTVAACYTLGSPRVGDQEFDMAIKVPVYRVVNAADIITRVPLMIMGYRHVGDLRYLTRDGRLIRAPNIMRTAARFLWNFVTDWQSVYQDHAILPYCEKLARIALDRQ